MVSIIHNVIIAIGIIHYYSYFSGSGHIYYGQGNYQYVAEYNKNDEIVMIYHPIHLMLQFCKNGRNQGAIGNIYAEKGLSYRLCVFLSYTGQQSMPLL